MKAFQRILAAEALLASIIFMATSCTDQFYDYMGDTEEDSASLPYTKNSEIASGVSGQTAVIPAKDETQASSGQDASSGNLSQVSDNSGYNSSTESSGNSSSAGGNSSSAGGAPAPTPSGNSGSGTTMPGSGNNTSGGSSGSGNGGTPSRGSSSGTPTPAPSDSDSGSSAGGNSSSAGGAPAPTPSGNGGSGTTMPGSGNNTSGGSSGSGNSGTPSRGSSSGAPAPAPSDSDSGTSAGGNSSSAGGSGSSAGGNSSSAGGAPAPTPSGNGGNAEEDKYVSRDDLSALLGTYTNLSFETLSKMKVGLDITVEKDFESGAGELFINERTNQWEKGNNVTAYVCRVYKHTGYCIIPFEQCFNYQLKRRDGSAFTITKATLLEDDAAEEAFKAARTSTGL